MQKLHKRSVDIKARTVIEQNKQPYPYYALEGFAKGQRNAHLLTGNSVVYTRVSSKEQELGYSLEIQLLLSGKSIFYAFRPKF